eukprot:2532635-Rhodomonas_salina.2
MGGWSTKPKRRTTAGSDEVVATSFSIVLGSSRTADVPGKSCMSEGSAMTISSKSDSINEAVVVSRRYDEMLVSKTVSLLETSEDVPSSRRRDMTVSVCWKRVAVSLPSVVVVVLQRLYLKSNERYVETMLKASTLQDSSIEVTAVDEISVAESAAVLRSIFMCWKSSFSDNRAKIFSVSHTYASSRVAIARADSRMASRSSLRPVPSTMVKAALLISMMTVGMSWFTLDGCPFSTCSRR